MIFSSHSVFNPYKSALAFGNGYHRGKGMLRGWHIKPFARILKPADKPVMKLTAKSPLEFG